MKTWVHPFPIRARLIIAALSLTLVCGFVTLHDIGTRGSGDIAFRVASAWFAGGLAFFGVFRSAQLQLLWSWSLVVAVRF
jgi:hypothetical protein